MPFFIRNKKSKGSSSLGKSKDKKRKAQHSVNGPSKKKGKAKNGGEVEDIPSSDSDIEKDVVLTQHVSDDEDLETEQEKKIRLAKKYLEEIEKQEKEKLEAEEIDKAAISHRLRDDLLEQSGRLQKKFAHKITEVDSSSILYLKKHKRPVTCAVISHDEKFVFSGSKDCCLIKWCAETGKRLKTVNGGIKGAEETHVGHTDHVMGLAISSDGKFLASGCQSKLIHVWNPETMERIHVFKGHRGPVTGVAFRYGTHELFSCSADRSVKIWNLDEMAYVETLFGHQDAVTGIDSYTRDRALTSGGRDNTLRIWKVVEESQLIFQSHNCSIDCVAMINELHFVSGADDGSLSLWTAMKKKPTCVVKEAHGRDNDQPYWIVSVAALRCTDFVASGSWSGEIKLWKCGEEYKSLHHIFSVPMPGFVNTLQVSNSGTRLVASIGQEHRLGRWWRVKTTPNCVTVVPIKLSEKP
ncbi:U3 small nucleolar RNA-interacting protein 2-like [Ornithodoros turicata]|uniref:U3 small nucleolar RNA-interacting protein 2-like n=1 Tax=Ornithodoros turicata TaxID=34597 RepID=UPI0031395588